MIVAVEDALSDSVARKLIRMYEPDVEIVTLGLRGCADLRAKARELNRAATSIPVFLMADQDTARQCPPRILAGWLGGAKCTANMLFRVAVMEVESWVLADRERFAALLRVPVNRIPLNTDAIRDPKQFLVNLARRSRLANIRRDIVPDPSARTAPIGPGYNSRLTAFVEDQWNPNDAAEVSPSLQKAMTRLAERWAA